MRCDCCDRPLSDAEATAKFVESGNYVGMCSACRKYLPKDLKVVSRSDLEKVEEDAFPEGDTEAPPDVYDGDFFQDDE